MRLYNKSMQGYRSSFKREFNYVTIFMKAECRVHFSPVEIWAQIRTHIFVIRVLPPTVVEKNTLFTTPAVNQTPGTKPKKSVQCELYFISITSSTIGKITDYYTNTLNLVFHWERSKTKRDKCKSTFRSETFLQK